MPKKLSARVLETGRACGSQLLARGGYRQSYVVRAHYVPDPLPQPPPDPR